MKVGYVRSAASAEEVEKLLEALESAGCERIFVGSPAVSPARDSTLWALVQRLKKGDTLSVGNFACIAETMPQLVSFVSELGGRGVVFESLEDGFATSPAVLDTFQRLSRFEQDLQKSEGEGEAAHRPRMGRPRALSHEDARRAHDMVFTQGRPVERVARELGVSKATLYRYLEEVNKQASVYADRMHGGHFDSLCEEGELRGTGRA